MIKRDLQLRAITSPAFRDFDNEMDLMDAAFWRPQLNERSLYWVYMSVEEYTTEDPIALEDISEGLEYITGNHNIRMPGCWGTPLGTAPDSDEPWSGGFADNH